MIINHNLRKESGAEAIKIKKTLKKHKIQSKILTWKGKIPISNIQFNARNIRFNLLSNECRKLNINNLLLGDPNATKEQVITASKIANAHQFIESLPEKYETNIGDRGNKLSGGQKQRLSIARAILKNPPILIFDEATSALDSESEKSVQIALENVMKNRTSIIIAHRLSTIIKADTIIVMDEGKILEIGSHEDLIHKNTKYKKLVEMQSL